MPDLCMCTGGGCPRKTDCYRYRAIPSPGRQPYYATPPVKSDGTCEDFLVLRPGDRLIGDPG